MKYTIETMDNELCNLESNDEKARKKASSHFMRAACKELGTKDTKQIKVWFITNTDRYISAIKKETNIDTIWNNVYTLQSFCARYIHLSHLYKADSDIITELIISRKKVKNTLDICLRHKNIPRYCRL